MFASKVKRDITIIINECCNANNSFFSFSESSQYPCVWYRALPEFCLPYYRAQVNRISAWFPV